MRKVKDKNKRTKKQNKKERKERKEKNTATALLQKEERTRRGMSETSL